MTDEEFDSNAVIWQNDNENSPFYGWYLQVAMRSTHKGYVHDYSYVNDINRASSGTAPHQLPTDIRESVQLLYATVERTVTVSQYSHDFHIPTGEKS